MNSEIDFAGTRIFYRVIGDGEPVVLAHGFGETGDVWNNQVEALRGKFKLIIPDLPGSGQSPVVNDMSMEGLAEVLRLIVQKETDRPCIMIGHSMGGYITLAYAEKYAYDLKAFGLVHSTAFADSDEKIATRKKGIEFIGQHGAFAFLKNATPNLFSPFTKDEKPALIADFIAELSNFQAEALVSYYEAMINRPDRTGVLRESTVPVLIVLGKYDTAIPYEDGLKLCHMAEMSYIHTLSRSGHMGMLEEPDRCNQLLDEFLTEAFIL